LTALVIASHGGPEAEMIRAALDADVGYIGLVASRTRGAGVLSELTLSEAERTRVHTPVGLDIHAKTAGEIAVAIVADLVCRIRTGGLRVIAAETRPPPTAVDPMCGMTVTIEPGTEHLRVSEEDHWFCSPACRASFAAMRLD
jgi:xanthine dehydrogenase accessory factor